MLKVEWKKLTLSDIPFVKPYFEKYYDGSCDMTVGGTFIWRDYYKTEFALYKNTLVFRENLTGSFCFPIGPEAEEAISVIGKAKYSFVTEKNKERLLSVFPEAKVHYNRDNSDYIYDAESMITLSGKSLSGQRNHINKFLRLYPDYSFDRITKENIDKVTEFFKKNAENAEKISESAEEDRKKTFEVLENYSEYACVGGVLSVGGEIIGGSIGEIVGDTLIVHIEKANVNFAGAYPMLTNQFNKAFAKNVRFINREDDAGNEGLRKNKLSYRPVKLLDKFDIDAR